MFRSIDLIEGKNFGLFDILDEVRSKHFTALNAIRVQEIFALAGKQASETQQSKFHANGAHSSQVTF